MTDNKTYWAIKQREWAAREAPPRSSSARRAIRGASVRKAIPEDVPYRELQAEAKELEIPANQSREDLESAIAEAKDSE
jgi:hypothetical protein